jgi:hypothetical protein
MQFHLSRGGLAKHKKGMSPTKIIKEGGTKENADRVFDNATHHLPNTTRAQFILFFVSETQFTNPIFPSPPRTMPCSLKKKKDSTSN